MPSAALLPLSSLLSLRRFASLSLALATAALLLAVGGPESAAAQVANIETVSGPGSGEQTTLSQVPRRVTDEVSIRAVGVSAPDSTRWAFSIIGGDAVEAFAFRAAGETMKPTRVDRPEGLGPISVYVTKEDFLTLSRTDGAVVLLDGTPTELPDTLQADMKAVFEEVV